MGKNIVRQTFLADGNWTCPAGVSWVRVTAIQYLFTQIAAGYQFSLGLDTAGTLWAQGTNSKGELGDGTTTNRTTGPVTALTPLKWRQVTAGVVNPGVAGFSMGVAQSGAAYGWGNNVNGQLGLGDVTARSSPVIVTGGFKWRQVAAGMDFFVGITAAGDAYTAGNNASGQLGNGDATLVSKSSPVIVTGGHKWVQVAAGDAHALGITDAGDVYSWGSNGYGQLGVGSLTPTQSSSPVLVTGGLAWKQVAAATGCSFGISDNAVTRKRDALSWGNNQAGQLGHNSVANCSSPIVVTGGLSWRQIAAGGQSANGTTFAGVADGGSLYACGYNADGQLGDGTVITRSSPVVVSGGLTWQQVIVSKQVMAIAADCNEYGWGANAIGQIGNGNTTPQSSPVIVSGGNVWPAVSEVVANTIIATVIPGTSYSVKLFQLLCSFNGIGLSQDPFANAATPTKFILEYEA